MKTVVLCSKKMSYDGLLDFSSLSEEVDVYEDSENVAERAKGAEVLITKENPVDRDLISRLPDSLKLIVEAGTGFNNIDIKAAGERGILVCNIPAYSTESVSEMAIAFLLMCSSSLGQQMRMIERGDKRNFSEYLRVSHNEVFRKTLGIIGEGHIGSRVRDVALALGMDVLVYTRTPKEDREGVRHASFEELLKQSDYISLHCPLTEKTRHIIDEKALSTMKKTAFLINTSRGALVDEEALIRALKEGTIAGAALDVQEREPLDPKSPLFDMDNVILTPHIGWKANDTRKRLLSIIKENIEAYRRGEPVNVVNRLELR